MRGYPQFSFWISVALAKICFTRIIMNRAKYFGISRPRPKARLHLAVVGVCIFACKRGNTEIFAQIETVGE